MKLRAEKRNKKICPNKFLYERYAFSFFTLKNPILSQEKPAHPQELHLAPVVQRLDNRLSIG